MRRTALWIALAALLLPTLAPLAVCWAADDPPEAGAAIDEPPATPAGADAETPPEEEGGPNDAKADEAGREDTLSASGLDELLTENPDTLFAIVLLKFVPLGIGVLLLVLWWLKRDKIRGGALPPPPPVTPTVPFVLGPAVLLAALGMVLLPALVTGILLGAVPSPPEAAPTTSEEATPAPGSETTEEPAPAAEEAPARIPLWIQIGAMGIGSLPVAAFVLLRRRRRLRGHDPLADPAVLPGGDLERAFEVPTPQTPAPGWVRAFALGCWGFCVATAFVVPVSMVWVLLLEALGSGAELQELVTRVYGSGPSYEPYLIAGFGVFVAPLVEETLFRGLLYPALRRSLGGTPKAVWISAIAVSFLFAAIHGSLTALVPLFVLALVLTWVMETTNSLAACIVAHAIHNAFALIPLLLLRAA